MSVERLKIKEDINIDKPTDNSKHAPSQKPHIANSKNNTSAHNASFDLLMSQLDIADKQAFNTFQRKQWKEAAIEQQQLAVLICDVDFYEEYLMHHGEQGASFMMLSVALAMKNSCLLMGGFLAHYEQRRFVVLAKGGDQNSTQEIADNLCKAVRNTRTEHKYSKVDNIVTLSIGFSIVHPGTMAILKKQANHALQNAKLLGGNKINHSHNNRHQAEIKSLFAKKRLLLKEKQLAPKQNFTAPVRSNNDLFPEPEKNKIIKTKSRPKMYRGQPILEPDNVDLEENKNIDSGSHKTQKSIKKKVSSIKMYRGHIITD
jgi:diguanylate cyclase (GGDEF)-like protein